MGEEKKYQHLVPRVYLKNWASRIDTSKGKKNKIVYINRYNKNNIFMDGLEVSTFEFGGINEYHTLTKDSLYLKEEYKQRIEDNETRILDIEHKLGVLENSWALLFKWIENNIGNTTKEKIPEYKKEQIISCVILMAYRGFKGTDLMKKDVLNLLSWIKDEKLNSIIHDIYIKWNEFSKDHLLEYRDKYLDGENGIITRVCEYRSSRCKIRFLVSPEGMEFLTSDNPSFECEITTNNGVSTTHIMPITKKIVIMLLNQDEKDGKYEIHRMTEDEVKNLNRSIVDKSYEYVVSNRTNIREILI
ncbi:MAG: DUF4238 domain-containing protein [Paraclostridium sp.]